MLAHIIIIVVVVVVVITIIIYFFRNTVMDSYFPKVVSLTTVVSYLTEKKYSVEVMK